MLSPVFSRVGDDSLNSPGMEPVTYRRRGGMFFSQLADGREFAIWDMASTEDDSDLSVGVRNVVSKSSCIVVTLSVDGRDVVS